MSPADGETPRRPRRRTPALASDADLQTNQYYLGLAYLGDQQYEPALETLAQVQTHAGQPGIVRRCSSGTSDGLRGTEPARRRHRAAAAVPGGSALGPRGRRLPRALINSLVQSNCLDEALRVAWQVGSANAATGFEAATLRLAEAAFEAGKYDDSVELFGILIEDRQPPEWASKGWSGFGWAVPRRQSRRRRWSPLHACSISIQKAPWRPREP